MRWLIACLIGSIALIESLAGGGSALAAQPEPWQMGLQPPGSPLMERIVSFHTLLLVIITVICIFVLALLVYVARTFRASRHATPSRRTHNTLLEVVWTAVPVLILVIIAIPSFRLLYYADVAPPTDMTIKAIGRQWYWTYEYPDHGNFTFDAFMLPEDELEPGMLRLLETDNRVVVPTNTNIKIQVTSSDVLHSWAMPSIGREDRRGARPAQRDLDQRHRARRLLRPVLRALRRHARLHADHHRGGAAGGVRPWVEEAKSMFARVDDDGTMVANR